MEIREHLPTLALTGGLTFASLVKTAVYEHRMLTHRSVDAGNGVETAFRVAGSHLADSKRWAVVHRVHHSTPDANLLPFVELADLLDWREGQSSAVERQLELPEHVEGFDPAAPSIPLEEARRVGTLARPLVEGLYKPEDFSLSRAKSILYDTEPRFFYEDRKVMKHDAKNPPTYDQNNLPSLDKVRFLLRDPHAPNLHRRGIPGIMLFNVPLYSYVEKSVEDAAFRPADLVDDKLDLTLRKNRGTIRLGYVGAVALANVALKHPSTLNKTAEEVLIGAAASGLIVLGLIQGGNFTNSLGHGGDLRHLTFRDFLAGKVIPKTDGTYTSKSTLLAGPTLDEVGGQDVHHEDPSLIAYTKEKGIRKVAAAPFGSAVEFLANRDILLKKGKGFPEQGPRPDMPSDAVLAIQALRREAIKNQGNIALAA